MLSLLTDVQMELEIKSRFEPAVPATQEAETGGMKVMDLVGCGGAHQPRQGGAL